MLKKEIVDLLSTTLDKADTESFIDEFIHIEKQFLLKQWKYTELNGGRFCELAARLLYRIDSGIVSPAKTVDDCLNYIVNEKVSHRYPLRKSALHLVRIIRGVYKLRSERGGVHVSPYFIADEIDAKFILDGCRWILAEYLRVFCTSKSNEIATILNDLARFQMPLIRDYGDRVLVQRSDLSTEEEILFVLYYSQDKGATRKFLNESVPKDVSTISKALKQLAGSKKRQIVVLKAFYHITDPGITRVEELVK